MLDDGHFLLFGLPTLIGFVLILGLTFGLADLDSHLSGDLETHADHDILSALGFGRVPFVFAVISLLLIFGCTGLILWIAQLPMGITVPFALFASYLGTRVITRLLSKVRLTLETNDVTAEHFIGQRATVTLVSGGEGIIQVSLNNDLYQFRFRSEDPVSKGSIVRIIDKEEGTGIYNVCLEP